MATGILSRSEKQNRYVNKNISKGICRSCSRKAEPDKTMCLYHLGYFKGAGVGYRRAMNKIREDKK